jgi:hypothetical protein
MAITYTWKVTGLKKTSAEGLTDVVIGTQWNCKGTDEDGNDGTFSGATPFKASDVNLGDFVDFADLTEETVLSWIQPVVTGGYWDHVREQIQKQIDGKKNPIIDVSAMPWAPANTANT